MEPTTSLHKTKISGIIPNHKNDQYVRENEISHIGHKSFNLTSPSSLDRNISRNNQKLTRFSKNDKYPNGNIVFPNQLSNSISALTNAGIESIYGNEGSKYVLTPQPDCPYHSQYTKMSNQPTVFPQKTTNFCRYHSKLNPSVEDCLGEKYQRYHPHQNLTPFHSQCKLHQNNHLCPHQHLSGGVALKKVPPSGCYAGNYS